MTTNTYAQTVAHANDANFRAWGAAYSAALLAVGLTQTADTGQIDWVTVTRPAVNTSAGYEIWTFTDTLQGTAPVYIKFEFGTGALATRPMTWITVGTGSDGAGTITGGYIARRTCNSTDNLPGTPTNQYFCHTAGFLGIGWVSFLSAGNPKICQLIILQRTCDASGAPTIFGLDCITRNDNSPDPHFQVAARFATVATPDIGGAATWINAIAPGDLNASSYDRSDAGSLLPDTYYQVFPVWSILQPDYPLFGMVAAYRGDTLFNTTGSTHSIVIGNFPARTFINVGDGHATASASTSSAQQTLFIWE